MRYTCVCKVEYQPDRLYVNGCSVLNHHSKWGGSPQIIYYIKPGEELSVDIKPNNYRVSQTIDGRTFEFSMDRISFLNFFSMRNFIRNKKLESIGI